MNKNISFVLKVMSISLTIIWIGCNAPTTDKQRNSIAPTDISVNSVDMQKVKDEIQSLEKRWAAADNARDVDTLTAFYADDAISMINGQPMITGKVSIRNRIVSEIEKRIKGSTISFETIDVYGSPNQVTEVGKTIIKDSLGEIVSTSKYMAIWEKRNGKYIVVRDIGNDDKMPNTK